VNARLEEVLRRIVAFPKSAPVMGQRRNLRVALLSPYPYRLLYRLRRDSIEVVRILHTARQLKAPGFEV